MVKKKKIGHFFVTDRHTDRTFLLYIDYHHHHHYPWHYDYQSHHYEKANEWGKRYKFWSCADVDIMPPNNFAQVSGADDHFDDDFQTVGS